MKKVYMFFTPYKKVIENILDLNFFPGHVSDMIYDEVWILYAYTTNKKYADSFFQLRKKEYFHMTIRKMNEEEYKKFRLEASCDLELEEYEYENITSKTTLITTQFEFNESRSLWIYKFSNETSEIFGYIPYFIIDTLKDKYLDAVIKLGLNAALLVIDEELAEMVDCCAEELFDDDYVLNISDRAKQELMAKKVFIKVSMASKTLNSFIHEFKGILTI